MTPTRPRSALSLSKPGALVTLLLACLVLLVPVAVSAAGEVSLKGEFIQGGLIFGQAAPGTEVSLDGTAVKVSPEGRFVFGFHRDAAPAATLTLRHPDGRREERALEIAKRDYKVQRIDGLPRKMVTPPAEVLARIKSENAQIAEVRAASRDETDYAGGFIWPAHGRISGVYGSQRILNGKPRQPHYGIDIAAPAGTPVWAPADGVVTLAETDLYYTGGTLIIDHGQGVTSAFLHMRDLAVTVGQRVSQGEPIGTVGSTGRSTGPHLDWRINWFKTRIDPSLLVGPMPKPDKATN